MVKYIECNPEYYFKHLKYEAKKMLVKEGIREGGNWKKTASMTRRVWFVGDEWSSL